MDTFGPNITFKKYTQGKPSKLNLVALMDIFTILVFFLLLNSGNTQHLDKVKYIKLPDSIAKGELHNDLLIQIGEEKILIGNIEVARVDNVLKNPRKHTKKLAEALKNYAKRQGKLTDYEKSQGRSVTIMGGQLVPYALLKNVMSTCAQQGFRDISLAVNQILVHTTPVSN